MQSPHRLLSDKSPKCPHCDVCMFFPFLPGFSDFFPHMHPRLTGDFKLAIGVNGLFYPCKSSETSPECTVTLAHSWETAGTGFSPTVIPSCHWETSNQLQIHEMSLNIQPQSLQITVNGMSSKVGITELVMFFKMLVLKKQESMATPSCRFSMTDPN